jgi:hypothetical protein
MQALTLFTQNFAVAESLLQLYHLFHGLEKADLHDELRLAICTFWGAPDNTKLRPAINDRVLLLARAAVPVPESLTMGSGLDFLLRQTVVVACTALESFFWDSLRENALTIVKAIKSRAEDEILKDIKFSLKDYISLQEYKDPEDKIQQIILKHFERGTLYDVGSIDQIAQTMTIKNYWEKIQQVTGIKAADLKTHIGELINRRNQIAHRADRPKDGEDGDPLGLRPINLAWTNYRVQVTKTLVAASAELFGEAIERLQTIIRAQQEQKEQEERARRVLEEISSEMEASGEEKTGEENPDQNSKEKTDTEDPKP